MTVASTPRLQATSGNGNRAHAAAAEPLQQAAADSSTAASDTTTRDTDAARNSGAVSQAGYGSQSGREEQFDPDSDSASQSAAGPAATDDPGQ